jgi:ABC-type Fe2+-enterobactin transport system substrate-binding protein
MVTATAGNDATAHTGVAIANRMVITGMTQIEGAPMSARILSTAIIAGLLLAVSAPAFAADAPKTKADCEKAKDMKWDDATKACVKK